MSVIRRSGEQKGNLVLRISPGDSLLIGNDVEVKLEKIEGFNRLKVLIIAPISTKVRRKLFEERNKVQNKGDE